jgi:hypothetical protein
MVAPTKPKCRARKRKGRCFELAGRAQLDEANSEWTLVHGWVNAAPGGSLKTGHAWLEHRDGFVFCAVSDEMMPTADYYARYGARAVVRYDLVEASHSMLDHKHWGPWHPLLDKHLGIALPADHPDVTGETQ